MTLYISLKRVSLHVLVFSKTFSVRLESYITTAIHNLYLIFSNVYNVEIDAAWPLSRDE